MQETDENGALAASNRSPDPPRSIASPCVQVCIVDGASGLCLGCYRTLQEIGGWRALGDEGRDRVMAELPSRRARLCRDAG
jgi:predicted Fe-S protein YdhL (DUF1289 family)